MELGRGCNGKSEPKQILVREHAQLHSGDGLLNVNEIVAIGGSVIVSGADGLQDNFQRSVVSATL